MKTLKSRATSNKPNKIPIMMVTSMTTQQYESTTSPFGGLVQSQKLSKVVVADRMKSAPTCMKAANMFTGKPPS